MIEEQGRISTIHGKPWHQVAPGSMPVHWLDSTHDGGPVDRPWERAALERQQREEREHRQRLERMARANIPPPHRNEERYGPLASNPEGDDSFRKDRTVWYEHVTGESLEGLTLTDQWERVDSIARRFREYTDGRATRPRQAMPDALPPPPPRPPPVPPMLPLAPPPPSPAPRQTQRRGSWWQRRMQALSTTELKIQEQILKAEVYQMVHYVAEADRRQLRDTWDCSKGQARHQEHDRLCMGLFNASLELRRRGLPHEPLTGQPKLFSLM